MTPATVTTTKKSLRIVEHLIANDGARTEDLLEAFEYSRATVQSHLRTLREEGYIIREDGDYRVSLATLRLGGKARSRYQSYLHGQSEIDQLAEEQEALVQIAFRENDRCVYVYQAGRRYSELTEPRMGSIVYFNTSAAGKAILSTQPRETIVEIIEEDDLRRKTPETITDPGALLEQIEAVQETKTAFDFEEHYPDVWCVSTPVVFTDDLVGSLSLSVRADSVSRERLTGDLADAVFRTGREIEIGTKIDAWMTDGQV
jgi:DNA-binding IclR family transcriptional regulator